MESHLYRKITIISYNNNNYQVFRDEKGRYAFLRIDDEGKYHYPEINEFIGLANIYSQEPDKVAFFKKSTANKFQFVASVLVASSIITCSSVLYNELQKQNQLDNTKVQEYISVADDYEQSIEETIENVVEAQVATTPSPVSGNKVIESKTASYTKSKKPTADMYKQVGNTIYIYDSAALNKFLGEKTVSINDIKTVINNNNNIPNDLKPLVIDFAEKEMKTFPNLDMRLFYENMKNIKFQYLTQEDITKHGNVAAWYDWAEMTIYINKNINLSPGSYDLKIFRHELCHTISLAEIKTKDNKKLSITIKDNNYGTYIQEAVAVLLSKDPFEKEYPDDDFGYGLIANEFEALTDIIPECDISILANMNINKIEEYFDNNFDTGIPAQRLFDLMEQQTIEYYNINQIKGNSEDYKDIYRYIARANITKKLSPNMSRDEIIAIRDDLIHNLNKHITMDDNLVHTDIIEIEFNRYMNENNISQSKTR